MNEYVKRIADKRAEALKSLSEAIMLPEMDRHDALAKSLIDISQNIENDLFTPTMEYAYFQTFASPDTLKEISEKMSATNEAELGGGNGTRPVPTRNAPLILRVPNTDIPAIYVHVGYFDVNPIRLSIADYDAFNKCLSEKSVLSVEAQKGKRDRASSVSYDIYAEAVKKIAESINMGIASNREALVSELNGYIEQLNEASLKDMPKSEEEMKMEQKMHESVNKHLDAVSNAIKANGDPVEIASHLIDIYKEISYKNSGPHIEGKDLIPMLQKRNGKTIENLLNESPAFVSGCDLHIQKELSEMADGEIYLCARMNRASHILAVADDKAMRAYLINAIKMALKENTLETKEFLTSVEEKLVALEEQMNIAPETEKVDGEIDNNNEQQSKIAHNLNTIASDYDKIGMPAVSAHLINIWGEVAGSPTFATIDKETLLSIVDNGDKEEIEKMFAEGGNKPLSLSFLEGASIDDPMDIDTSLHINGLNSSYKLNITDYNTLNSYLIGKINEAIQNSDRDDKAFLEGVSEQLSNLEDKIGTKIEGAEKTETLLTMEHQEHAEPIPVNAEGAIEAEYEETGSHTEPLAEQQAEHGNEGIEDYNFTQEEQSQRDGLNEWEEAVNKGIKAVGEDKARKEAERIAQERLSELMTDYLGRKKNLEKAIYGQHLLVRAFNKLITRPIKGIFRFIKQMFGGTPNYSPQEIELMELKATIQDIKKNGVEFANGKLYRRDVDLAEKLAMLQENQEEDLSDIHENEPTPQPTPVAEQETAHSNDAPTPEQPLVDTHEEKPEPKKETNLVLQEKEKLCKFMQGKGDSLSKTSYVIADMMSKVANGKHTISEKQMTYIVPRMNDFIEGKADSVTFFVNMYGPKSPEGEKATDKKDNKVKVCFEIKREGDCCSVLMYMGRPENKAKTGVSMPMLPAQAFSKEIWEKHGHELINACLSDFAQHQFDYFAQSKFAREIMWNDKKHFRGDDIQANSATYKAAENQIVIHFIKHAPEHGKAYGFDVALDLKTMQVKANIPENVEAQMDKANLDRIADIKENLPYAYARCVWQSDVPHAKYLYMSQDKIAQSIDEALNGDAPTTVVINGLEVEIEPKSEANPFGVMHVPGVMGDITITGSKENPLTSVNNLNSIYKGIEETMDAMARMDTVRDDRGAPSARGSAFDTLDDHTVADNKSSNDAPIRPWDIGDAPGL